MEGVNVADSVAQNASCHCSGVNVADSVAQNASCHCSGVNAADMSLRAHVSERGNPINIICQLVICPIVSMRLLHILRMFVMTRSCGGLVFYLMESGKRKIRYDSTNTKLQYKPI